MANGSHVRVELDMDELVASYVFQTTRARIDSAGASGIWNGFGRMIVRINDESVCALQIHEDDTVGVVLDVLPIRDGKLNAAAYRIELEDRGIVPPRTERTDHP